MYFKMFINEYSSVWSTGYFSSWLVRSWSDPVATISRSWPAILRWLIWIHLMCSTEVAPSGQKAKSQKRHILYYFILIAVYSPGWWTPSARKSMNFKLGPLKSVSGAGSGKSYIRNKWEQNLWYPDKLTLLRRSSRLLVLNYQSALSV